MPTLSQLYALQAAIALSLVTMVVLACTNPVPVPEPPAEPIPPVSTTDQRVAEIVAIHNANRTSSLTLEEHLTAAAQKHADWMAANRRMSHRGEGGSSPGTRIKAAGYQWSTYGENVAYGQTSPEQVMGVWLRSPGHRRNIKSSAYSDIGVGIAESSSGSTYWCVTFGSTSFGADDWDESWSEPDFEETCHNCKGKGTVTNDEVCPYCAGRRVLTTEIEFEQTGYDFDWENSEFGDKVYPIIRNQ